MYFAEIKSFLEYLEFSTCTAYTPPSWMGTTVGEQRNHNLIQRETAFLPPGLNNSKGLQFFNETIIVHFLIEFNFQFYTIEES